METRHAKTALRADASRRRAALEPAYRRSAAERVAAAGLPFLDLTGSRVISGYRAIADELDPLPLLESLLGQGHAIALPAVVALGMPLIFRQWTSGDALETGVFDVPVPLPDQPELEPDIVLVPLLAFDRTGYRLGYGAGFYDRTLAGLRARRPVTAVGLAFGEQEVDGVPHDEFDERLDWIVTPAGFLRIEG